MWGYPPPEAGLVLVGIVARPHGLKGHVIVNPETDFAAVRFAPGSDVLVSVEGRLQRLTVSSLRFQANRPIVGFDGLESIEAVEPLADQALWIREADRPPLDAGWYYHSDLIGCRVETMAGTTVGHVARVDDSGGVPLLAIDRDRGEVLIPLAESICREIDAVGKRIVIDPPEGLLELNAREEPGQ
jgi:16S rRNA processing protein RimM